MRLTDSLILSPDSPVDTLEEAAVVLGTDRLRVLASICGRAVASNA